MADDVVSAYIAALRRDDRDEAGDLYNELVHQGDLNEIGVAAAPLFVVALQQEPGLEADLLYGLADMCVAPPDVRATRVRAVVAAAADVFRRLLEHEEADARAGAVAALAAAGILDRADAAALAREDPAPVVRSHAVLGLGLAPGEERLLEELLRIDEPLVRHSAALALARLGHGSTDVARTLAESLLQLDDESSPTELPPWDDFYPPWTDEVIVLGADAAPAVPLLLDGFDQAPPWLVDVVLEALLHLSRDDAALRRKVVQRLLDAPGAWRRGDLNRRYVLEQNGLPGSRKELRAWLDHR